VSQTTAELLRLWEEKVCPNCGSHIADGKRVGTGRKADGGFCSLDCYASYYSGVLVERAAGLQAGRTQKPN
jgi:hypothetical protein